MPHTPGRTVAALFTAAIASAALASSASAGVVTASATGCDDGALTQPFARFDDSNHYKLVDNGSFENGAGGWTLTGGAAAGAGNESYSVRAAGDDTSLQLPAGSSATSPFVCVGANEPTLRLFAKRNSAALGLASTLQVQIQLQTSLGLTAWLPVAAGDIGGSSWHPTIAMPYLVNLLTLGDRTQVRFRFAPLLGGWQIDDVYVDPARMR
jgi:hypothetical protein